MCDKPESRDGAPLPKVITPPNEAEYLAEMCKELKEIASQSGLSMLAYFLSLAELEAKAQASPSVTRQTQGR